MIELVLCTLIWGASFIAQKLGADHFGPVAINCYRNLLAGFFLWGALVLGAVILSQLCTRSAAPPGGGEKL